MISENYFYGNDVNNDGTIDALWCQSSSFDLDIARWYLPDGGSAPGRITVQRFGQVGLLRDTYIRLGNYQGIYRCVVYDENYIEHVLIVAIYNFAIYNAIGKINI